MARQEIDREDLLREATALVSRVEFRGPAGRVVVAGLRVNGAGSIYFDGEPTYQFNEQYELRRAYRDGLLWKAENGRLVALQRQRSDTQVILQRMALDSDEQSQWLSKARQEVCQFQANLVAGVWQVTGTVPQAAAGPRIMQWLEQITHAPWEVARRPHAGTKTQGGFKKRGP